MDNLGYPNCTPMCDRCLREHEKTQRDINEHEMRNFGGAYGLISSHCVPLSEIPEETHERTHNHLSPASEPEGAMLTQEQLEYNLDYLMLPKGEKVGDSARELIRESSAAYISRVAKLEKENERIKREGRELYGERYDQMVIELQEANDKITQLESQLGEAQHNLTVANGVTQFMDLQRDLLLAGQSEGKGLTEDEKFRATLAMTMGAAFEASVMRDSSLPFDEKSSKRAAKKYLRAADILIQSILSDRQSSNTPTDKD
jgi:hypothetical protein